MDLVTNNPSKTYFITYGGVIYIECSGLKVIKETGNIDYYCRKLGGKKSFIKQKLLERDRFERSILVKKRGTS